MNNQSSTTIKQLVEYQRRHEEAAAQILRAEVERLRQTLPDTPEANLRAIAMNAESVRRPVLHELRRARSIGHTIRQRTRRGPFFDSLKKNSHNG